MNFREDLTDLDAENSEPTLASLQSELAETRRRLAEAEQTLHAIRSGEVDAIIVHGVAGPQAYTLKTASEPYRHIVEQMPEAALTVTADGLIVYCNAAFANMVGRPAERIAGALLAEFVAPDTMQQLLASGGNAGCDLSLVPLEGGVIDCHASSTELPFGGERVFCCVITNLTGQRLKAQHDAIVQASNSAIYMLSPQLLIETWNPAAARLYGYTAAEIIGHSGEEMCAPGGFKVLQDLFTRARRGEPVSADVVRRRKDGTTCDVMESLAAVRDAAGGISGFVSISLDISERLKAAAELRRVSVLLDTLLQTAPLGFCFLDLDLRFVRINERLAEINGIPAGAHLGRHVSELLPTLVEKLREVTGRILATGEAVLDHEFSGETPATPGVTHFWCEHWYPVRNGAGQIMGFGAIIEDITERKRAEEKLRESEARLRMALQAARAGVWEAVPDRGKFSFVASDQALALHGLAPGAAMTHDNAFAMVLPEDRQRVDMELRRTLDTGAPLLVEFRSRQSDGSIRWLQSQAELRTDVAGGRLVGLVRDITERKQREQNVEFLMDEVNHRSKNLLGVVMSVARQTGGPDNQEFVRRLSDRIGGLALSHDLLAHSLWQSVDLESLVQAQLFHFKGLFGTRITICGEAVNLSAASAQTIGLALHELATNATKYGAMSDDNGKVAISWEMTGTAGSVDSRFAFRWRESDGPQVVAPTRHGFGSTVTGKMVKVSLDAKVSAEYAKSGFVWHLDCPAENVVEK
jgi:PAS domain S-box-containing protein